MAFRLKRGEPIGPGLLRLADRQLRLAGRQLRTLEPDRERAVHQARRRCKRVRAVLRLLRQPLGEQRHAELNRQVRDAAARLSGTRDADVLLATASALGEKDAAWLSVVNELARLRQEQQPPDTEQPTGAAQSADELERAGEQLRSLALTGTGRQQLRRALQRDYRRARRRLPELDTGLEGEAWHAWRKAVKAHGLQLDVIRRAIPSSMRERRRAVNRLGKLLGVEHDLQVLAATLAAAPDAFGKPADIRHCMQAVAALRARRQEAALELGLALFAAPPGKFSRRLKLKRV